MKAFPKRFSETIARFARFVLGIREITLLPGVRKVIMRAAGIVEYRIEFPWRTAEDIAERVKRFLWQEDIPYSESGDMLRLESPKMGAYPCLFIPGDGVASFYTAVRFREKGSSRWDSFMREIKIAS